MSQSVQFEGDERLRIPPGTEWERVFAIRRYWSAWPTYREAVLERFAEADKRAAEFREQYPKKPPVAALKTFQQNEPNASAVFASRQYFEIGGGPLGTELFDFEANLGPAHHTEEKRFANASNDELWVIPPVRVVFYADADNAQPAAFVIVAGESEMTPLASLRDRFAAARAFGDLLESSASADPLGTLREAYRAFATSFWDLHEKGELAETNFVPTPGIFSRAVPKQTFRAFHRVEQSYADKQFTEDGARLIHRARNRKGEIDPIEVIIEPLENPQWLPPSTLRDLKVKLERVGASAPFAFAVAVSLAVEYERPTLELDEFIKLLGMNPRSSREREEQRSTLWECLQIFAQTSAVGEIRGHFRGSDGKKIARIEHSPIIAITGRQYPQTMRLDKSEPPLAVSYTLGDQLYRHRGNRKLLAHLGDLRQLAAIPSGKPAGQWARSIGLALLQIWREDAQNARFKTVGEDDHVSVQFRRVSRREVFRRVTPNPNPLEILSGDHPSRARDYWEGALALLHDAQFLQQVGAVKSDLPRKAWQEAWLDQDLDLRPHRENYAAIEGTRSVSNGARAHLKKRGRPKKTP